MCLYQTTQFYTVYSTRYCQMFLYVSTRAFTRCFYYYQMFLPLPDVSTITKCFSPCLHVLLLDVSTITRCFSTFLHVLFPNVSTITRCFSTCLRVLLPDVSTITICLGLHVVLPDVFTITRCFYYYHMFLSMSTRAFTRCFYFYQMFPYMSTRAISKYFYYCITRCFSICLHVLLPDGTCTMYTFWLHGIQLVSIPHSWRPMIHENGVYIYCTCVVPGGNIHCPKNSLQHSEVQL